MTDTTQSLLVDLLVTRYDEFKRRLTARLGSAELASEALQDTFLRLRSATILDEVQSPRAYLMRTALNIAINRVVSEKRRMTSFEIDAMVEIPDETPDPTRVIEGRSDIEALKRALDELPPRRREIVLAAAFNDVPYATLATRFGVTVRTIQIEMKHALAHCAQRLDRPSAPFVRVPGPLGDDHQPIKRRRRSALETVEILPLLASSS